MAKLKLGPILDEKPVRVTTELPAVVYRDLVAYAEVLGREIGKIVEPSHVIAPMLARFMAADRAFLKARKAMKPPATVAALPVSSSVPPQAGELDSGNA